jgi:hypothetical protein
MISFFFFSLDIRFANEHMLFAPSHCTVVGGFLTVFDDTPNQRWFDSPLLSLPFHILFFSLYLLC